MQITYDLHKAREITDVSVYICIRVLLSHLRTTAIQVMLLATSPYINREGSGTCAVIIARTRSVNSTFINDHLPALMRSSSDQRFSIMTVLAWFLNKIELLPIDH